jgi:hypothetical protein
VTLQLRTLHPQYLGASFVWWRTTGRTILNHVTHEVQDLYGHVVVAAPTALAASRKGTSPIQAEKLRPDRNALGSATLDTKAVASSGKVVGSGPRRVYSRSRRNRSRRWSTTCRRSERFSIASAASTARPTSLVVSA